MFIVIRRIWNWLKKYGLWILGVIVAIFPLAFYIWRFHSYSLSDNPTDWAVFGDFVGGVYSVIIAVLVVYLARNLERKDEEKRIKKESIRAVYEQITFIQRDQQPNQNKVTKLFRLIEDCKLFIDDDFYERLKGLANHLGAKGRDRQLEKEIKDELKAEYEK